MSSRMSEQCPVSGAASVVCPAVLASGSMRGGRTGPRGCTMSGFAQTGDIHAAFGVGSVPKILPHRD